MDKQTNEMDASEILEHFFEYHKNIGSKACLRMKTSENIYYFRSEIIDKLEDIIREIDQKHTRYMKNAVMRAKFLMSTGNNLEGRLLQILNLLAEELNEEAQPSIYDEITPEVAALFHLYPQRYISPESLKVIPVTKDDHGDKVIKEYTDYRSYLDYDIEIHKKNGTVHDYAQAGDFCIYLGGFHNQVKQKVLRRILYF